MVDSFERFVQERELGSSRPVQYELTYIDQIPQGEGWDDLADVGKVFPDFRWRASPSRQIHRLEGVQHALSCALPDGMGRLHVRLRSGVRASDNRHVLYLELTARGVGPERSRQAMDGWFDLAHRSIVLSFADLADEAVQRDAWGRAP